MKFPKHLAAAGALLVALGLNGCATFPSIEEPAPRPSPAAAFSFVHNAYDLHHAWKISKSDHGLRIDALVKNVSYPKIEDLEVQVVLVNRSKKVLARTSIFPRPQPIGVDEYRQYQVELKDVQPMPGDRLEFLSSYVASAAQASFSWTSNFAVDAMTGVLVGSKEKIEDW